MSSEPQRQPRAAFGRRRGPRGGIHDAGMQHERTALAWDRTGLAMIVGGALFMRAGNPPYHHPRHLPGVVMIGLGTLVLVLAFRRYESRNAQLRAGQPVAQPGLVRVVGTATVAFCAAALGLVVLGG